MGESIQCWQCGTRMTLDELASNDGDCPRCEVEVHLAEYLDNALSRVATLEPENAKLRAELERRAVDGWRLVPVEPTEEMLESDFISCPCGHDFSPALFDHVWHKMLAAAPSAPATVPDAIAMADVMRAWEYAEDHPHKYLRGTTNWCAAVAHSLNQQQREARPLYTCIGKGGEYRYLGTAIGAGDSRGELAEVYQDRTGQLFHRTPEDFMERMEPIAAARQEGGKV